MAKAYYHIVSKELGLIVRNSRQDDQKSIGKCGTRMASGRKRNALSGV